MRALIYLFVLCKFFTLTMSFEISRSFTLRSLVKSMWTSNNDNNDKRVNPDINLNTPQMIKRAGYPAESHIVSTEDGYLLTLHRIPGLKESPPVLLQHGFLGSSADWVISGRGKGLAFILADRGYDVWLGNFRGNIYSRAHIFLLPSDSRFWNYSFHEMGVHDLPSMISYITNFKSQALHTYIGHSMGTTAFYIMAAECPQIAQTVQAMVSLAPVAFMKHLKSPIRYFAPFADNYEMIAHFFGEDEFLPQNSILKFLSKYACDIDLFEEKICANALFLIAGFDKKQFNYTLLPVILSHTPAGGSTKTLVHYGQEILSGKFRQYDYGKKRNMIIYNSTEPPDYNMKNVTVPIALFYADNDWLANSLDVKRLYGSLNNKLDMYRVPFPTFNHLDFLWGIDAPKLVYERVLKIMENQME